MLRRISGPKRDEIIGISKKLPNEDVHSVYYSSYIIRMIKSMTMRWAGHVACMGEKKNAYRILVGKPERKRPLGRPLYRWEDNIKIDLREIWGGMDWINLAQDMDRWQALVNTAMNLGVP
jgi:hypothetical protein